MPSKNERIKKLEDLVSALMQDGALKSEFFMLLLKHLNLRLVMWNAGEWSIEPIKTVKIDGS